MNLHRLLQQRAAAGRPVRVGLIGAGKFGSMFLTQVPTIAGAGGGGHRRSRPGAGARRLRQGRLGRQRASREPGLSPPAPKLCADPEVEVVVEATGAPAAGIAHARAAIAAGKHIVMVNVEADVLAGPLLAEEARAKGVVYSLAYGDQPALICELVDWARACGFDGRGRRQGHQVPAGLSPRHARRRLGPLRPDPGRGAGGGHEPADVQLVPRRHQVGDRDGGDRQRHRARRAGRRARLSALRRRRPAACAARPRGGRRAGARRHGRGRLVAWSATAGRCSATCAGASTSCSRRRTTTRAPASANTA